MFRQTRHHPAASAMSLPVSPAGAIALQANAGSGSGRHLKQAEHGLAEAVGYGRDVRLTPAGGGKAGPEAALVIRCWACQRLGRG